MKKIKLNKKIPILISLIFLLSILFFTLLNAANINYPDEFDTLLGGKLILHGILPYKGFLSHHNPVSYFLASPFYLIAGASLVRFRILYAIALAVFFFWINKLLKKDFGDKAKFFPIFIFCWVIAAGYYWMHMMLADNLSALILIYPFFFIFLSLVYKRDISRKEIKRIAWFLGIALLNSMTYIYFIFCLSGLLVIYQLVSKKSIKEGLYTIWRLMLPYILFFVYLFITGSLKDYLYQTVEYNRKYYIFNSDQNTPVNPIRYAITIAKKAWEIALPGFENLLKFNIDNPRPLALLGMIFTTGLVMLWNKKIWAIFPLLFLISFTTPRTYLMTMGAADYQSAVYITLALGLGCFLIMEGINRQFIKKNNWLSKVGIGYSWILVAIFMSIMTQQFMNRNYDKSIGNDPLVYDRPEIAKQINKIIDKKEYAWVGPFRFEDLYYLNAKLPSKYNWLLPANAKSEKIRTEMMADFNKNKPVILVFDKNYSAFGAAAGDFNYFMVEFINKNYTLVNKCNIAKINQFICKEQFYVLNDRKDEILNKMGSLGMIEK